MNFQEEKNDSELYEFCSEHIFKSNRLFFLSSLNKANIKTLFLSYWQRVTKAVGGVLQWKYQSNNIRDFKWSKRSQ